ncbi:MAG: ATP-binding protein [Pseudomonadota bacterium]
MKLASYMLSSSIYQSIFDRSPVGEYILSASSDPVILAVNESFLKVAGRRREDLVGKPLFKVFPGNPDDSGDSGLPALRSSLERVIATGLPDEMPMQRYPIRVAGPDGLEVFEERYWSALNTPIVDDSGALACISHRTRDVTEVWRMQDALRRNHERQIFQLELADALRPLGSPHQVVGTALQMLAQRLNVSRLMYVEVDDARGTFLVRNEWVAPGHQSIAGEPRVLEDFGAGIIDLLRSGQPMVVPDVATDPATRDHMQAYASIGVRANLAIPLVKAGKLTIVLSVHNDQPRVWTEEDIEGATDVAERTWAAAEQARAQQEVLASERSFRLLANAVPQIIWITDNAGRALFFNRQWHDYTGEPHDPASTAANVSSRFVHPDDAAATLLRFGEAQRLGVTFSIEHRIRRADGVYRWFLVRAEPERDPQTGEITRWFGSSTDISALKEAEQALRDADRRKDEFLATLAHELRNPLAPISSAIAILRSPQTRDESRTRMLDLMERQARHLVRLVDDLLEVSRITSGKINIKLERVDLRAIAQASVDAAGGDIRDSRHQVSLRVPAQPVWVSADPVRMKQVVDNLLNNAIKYTPAAGDIEVEVASVQERGIVTVRDNGAGIPPEMLEGVFTLFSQVDHTIGRARGGLGIGLALVRQLVALHHGEVSAASGGIGAGTTMQVVLPLAPAAEPLMGSGAGSEPLRTRHPKRVLVIDDNRDAADTIAGAINLTGHHVEVAYDGASGLEAAQRMRPDCILLDLGMPDMDGHQVARALRRNPDHDRCLIVALTGWGQQHDRTRARQSGFDVHLVKPASIESVVDLLEIDPIRQTGQA